VRPLRSAWTMFKSRLSHTRERLLLLDFDGTLAPIESTPEEVRLDPRTHRVLEKLSRKRTFRLVIVSGRSLKDLKRFFHLPRAILVGNHGLEARPASVGLSKSARAARRASRRIRVLATKLGLVFRGWPGVRVENKTYTLTLHYRNIAKDRLALFQHVVDFYRKEQGKSSPLLWKPGKKVWEVRPRGYWGKADVAMHFMKKFPKAFMMAAGDDLADDEMFEVVAPKGFAVRVGRSARSAANYYLDSPKQMREFLEELSLT
jgi:trehalose-phosphatase